MKTQTMQDKPQINLQFFTEREEGHYTLLESHERAAKFEPIIYDELWKVAREYYELGHTICSHIQDLWDSSDSSELNIFLDELDADEFASLNCPAYTKQMTEWLNSDIYHVYYLSEALDNNPKDGFQALAMAYNIWQVEIFRLIVKHIKNAFQE